MVAKEPMVARDLGSRIRRRGLMLVLSSPSGAGKSTIARNLLESDSSLELSVSVTTRPRRGSEIEGVHYHFRTMREFERLRDSDALLEWAEVHGNCYATPREPAELALAQGRDCLAAGIGHRLGRRHQGAVDVGDEGGDLHVPPLPFSAIARQRLPSRARSSSASLGPDPPAS